MDSIDVDVINTADEMNRFISLHLLKMRNFMLSKVKASATNLEYEELQRSVSQKHIYWYTINWKRHVVNWLDDIMEKILNKTVLFDVKINIDEEESEFILQFILHRSAEAA
jgi:hypothetical protein